ncbi:hypothetical protein [Microvirga sp. VF16]|uniref:hypothetical protein n=1 Tax=Microvirga sp. VF16 TaxID=2807101 RepID=UPI00193D99AB|nr:hypothetical protein [Microvirga sp. VF16]QRM34965.1 hypothetical protein JO965_42660 [Microvirga sp. VF16]
MKHMIERYGLVFVVAGLATLVITLISGVHYGLQGLLLPLSDGTALTIGISWLVRWYPTNLTKRIEADAPDRWSIWMNNVEVGSVTDAQYAEMQLQAVRDRRNAVAQLRNLGRVAIFVSDRLILAVPVLLFYGSLALALYSPDFFMAIVSELQNGDTASNLSFVRFLLLFTVTVSLVCFFTMSLFGYRFGFTNCYSLAVAESLRDLLNIPEDCEIHVSPTVQEDIVGTA